MNINIRRVSQPSPSQPSPSPVWQVFWTSFQIYFYNVKNLSVHVRPDKLISTKKCNCIATERTTAPNGRCDLPKIGAASSGDILKSVLSLYCGRPGPPGKLHASRCIFVPRGRSLKSTSTLPSIRFSMQHRETMRKHGRDIGET